MLQEHITRVTKKIGFSFEVSEESDEQANSVFLSKASSEEDIFYVKYLLNMKNQILYLRIINFELVPSPFGGQEYIVYVIKILTQNFGYQLKRRYSQFQSLFNRIRQEKKKNDFQYSFPIKTWSHSISSLFGNSETKQKIAKQRRSPLEVFINEIKHNYESNNKLYRTDFLNLLKFLKVKQQSEIKERLKEGKLPQLQKVLLNGKENPNSKLSLRKQIGSKTQYLNQLLNHQLTKINLKNEEVENQSLSGNCLKNLQNIVEIVLELKKSITPKQIKTILLGNNELISKQMHCFKSVQNEKPKGLIQIALSQTENELVLQKFLQIFMNMFFNPQINYSADLFKSILIQIPPKLLKLSQQNQQFILNHENIEFHMNYFKLVELYISQKIIAMLDEGSYCEQKVKNRLINSIMSSKMTQIFVIWEQNYKRIKKNSYEVQTVDKMSLGQLIQQSKKSLGEQLEFEIKYFDKMSSECKNNKIVLQNLQCLKKIEEGTITLTLETEQNQDVSYYCFNYVNQNENFPKQLQKIILNQQQWNPLLKDEYIDQFSNTKKQTYQFSGRQPKNFRFTEAIDFGICLQQEKKQDKVIQNIQSINISKEKNSQKIEQLESTQYKSSVISNKIPCVMNYCHSNELEEDHETVTIVKQPPRDHKCNSFKQVIKILKCNQKQKVCVHVKIEYFFQQPNIRKFFRSQVSGKTSLIWDRLSSLLII